MKDLLYRGLEWFSRLEFIEKMSDNEFCRGIIIGIIAGVVLIFLLRFILWLCLRRKACSEIRIENSSGSVVVSAGAVSSVLKHAAAGLTCLEISRIKIFRRRKGLDIRVKSKMDVAKGSAPQLMDKLAVIIREEMKNVFGIENIRDIRLIISGCPCNDDFEDDFADDDSAGDGDKPVDVKAEEPEKKAGSPAENDK